MQDNLITFSVKNWVTVFVMFLMGWAVVALGGRLIASRFSAKGNTAQENPAGTGG